jgi:hypothetical protein
VTAIVPDEFTVNERLLCPPGATTPDQFSLVVADVLLGAVDVLLSPHPVAKSAITSHGDTEARSQNFLVLRFSVAPWLVSVKVATLMGA